MFGMETTRTFFPCALSSAFAFTASATSDPVAIRMYSGMPSQSSMM